jgi:hypothetical protein
MGKLKFILASLLGVVVLSSFAAPKEKKADIEEPKRVYMYGVSFNFNDSVVYMTDILYLDSMLINKDGSLQNHADFSHQLKVYMELSLGKTNQTCAVIYSDKKKKLEKRFVKLQRELSAKRSEKLRRIGTDEFAFKRR